MVLEIIFEAPYTDWGWKIGQYVALVGIAGGAYVFGFMGDLLSTKFESQVHGQIAKYGYLTGIVMMVIGPPIMLSHLATPFKASLVPITMSNYSSWMAIGSHILLAFGLAPFVMFLWTAFGRERPNAPTLADGGEEVATDGGDITTDGGTGPAEAATPGGQVGGVRGIADRVGLLGLLDKLADITRPPRPVRLALGAFFAAAGLGVLLYSAMALGSGSTGRVPLWDKTYLIPLQIIGGLGAGLVVSVGLTALVDRSSDRTLGNYALVGATLLLASLVVLALMVLNLPEKSATAAASVENMLTTWSWLFVGVAIVAGLVVPVLLSVVGALGQRFGALSPTATRSTYVVSAALAVVGKIALGMTLVLAAEYTSLSIGLI